MSEKSSNKFVKVSEKQIHQENWFSFVAAQFMGPAGELIERYVFHHPGAVGVVPIDGDEVVLVRQFRPALEMEMLEIPAGKLDIPGEAPVAAAKRELIEEAGLEASELKELCRFHNSAGFSDELTVVFLALDMRHVGSKAVSIEEEYMTIERVPLEQVEELISDGIITDAKTVMGLYAALRFLGK